MGPKAADLCGDAGLHLLWGVADADGCDDCGDVMVDDNVDSLQRQVSKGRVAFLLLVL